MWDDAVGEESWIHFCILRLHKGLLFPFVAKTFTYNEPSEDYRENSVAILFHM